MDPRGVRESRSARPLTTLRGVVFFRNAAAGENNMGGTKGSAINNVGYSCEQRALVASPVDRTPYGSRLQRDMWCQFIFTCSPGTGYT